MSFIQYLPKFPLHLNSITLLGLTLLLGLVGGEFAKRVRYVPQIFGYILVGFLIGSGGFNIVNQAVLINARLFIDISLSLILFELGRHLDFTWLRHDPSIIWMSLTESILTFIGIFGSLHFLAGLAIVQSSLAATIAIATSPAVVMMIAYDLSAQGPVTRRAMILTSLNNLYALILFIMLGPLVQKDLTVNILSLPIYRLVGSILLSLVIFIITKAVARLIGKHKENQFVLFVGTVLFALGFSHLFNFSSMLTLFMLGVAARNFDYNHDLMEVNFGWLARLFFVLLFVVTGLHLKIDGLLLATEFVILFIFLRMLAKVIGIGLFSKSSGLTHRQSVALSFTLCPMAGIAIGMSNRLVDFNPDFGNQLLLIITGVVTLFNIIGPILTQLAFIMTGESIKQQNERES